MVIIDGNSKKSQKQLSRQPDPYAQAHLVVAAIRVLEHQQKAPPSAKQVGELLSLSTEQTLMICRKLLELGAIGEIQQAEGSRLFIEDHLMLENIPRGQQEDPLRHQLEKFKQSQKGLTRKIESIAAGQAEKKKSLFADLEEKLKKELAPKTKN